MTFFSWLGQQVERQDAVGTFARYAVRDKAFPRGQRQLYVFLARYEGMPEQRRGAKLAHGEWRRWRKEQAA